MKGKGECLAYLWLGQGQQLLRTLNPLGPETFPLSCLRPRPRTAASMQMSGLRTLDTGIRRAPERLPWCDAGALQLGKLRKLISFQDLLLWNSICVAAPFPFPPDNLRPCTTRLQQEATFFVAALAAWHKFMNGKTFPHAAAGGAGAACDSDSDAAFGSPSLPLLLASWQICGSSRKYSIYAACKRRIWLRAHC